MVHQLKRAFSGHHRSQSGFTLIEILIAVSVMSLIGMAFMSLMDQMHKELKWANRKVEALEFRMMVARSLSDLSLCSCQLNKHGSRFNSLVPKPQMAVSKFQSSCLDNSSVLFAANEALPGSSTQLEIQSLKIIDIESLGSPNLFRGRFQVEYKSDPKSIQMRGFEIDLRFRTDAMSPDTDKKIVQCESSSSSTSLASNSLGTCPTGQFMTGIQDGSVQCSAVAVGGSVSNGNGEFSPTNPGPGCKGIGCVTADYGVCDGIGCATNGNFCKGKGCLSCGPSPACEGDLCNHKRESRCKDYGF